MPLRIFQVEESGVKITVEYDDSENFQETYLPKLFRDQYEQRAELIIRATAFILAYVPKTGYMFFGTFMSIWVRMLTDVANQMTRALARLANGENPKLVLSEISPEPPDKSDQSDSDVFSDFINNNLNLDDLDK